MFIATGRIQDAYPCPHVMTQTTKIDHPKNILYSIISSRSQKGVLCCTHLLNILRTIALKILLLIVDISILRLHVVSHCTKYQEHSANQLSNLSYKYSIGEVHKNIMPQQNFRFDSESHMACVHMMHICMYRALKSYGHEL